MTEWRRYFEHEKEGNKFIIIKVYDEPLPITEGKSVGNNLGKTALMKKHEKQFLITLEEQNCKGVYIIKLNNVVYIGSTTVSFRHRYRQHLYNYKDEMANTKQLLDCGATFDLLWIAKDDDSVESIRKKEQEYIDTYSNKGYKLVNRELAYRKETYPRFKKILLSLDDFEKAILILKQNNIQVQ